MASGKKKSAEGRALEVLTYGYEGITTGHGSLKIAQCEVLALRASGLRIVDHRERYIRLAVMLVLSGLLLFCKVAHAADVSGTFTCRNFKKWDGRIVLRDCSSFSPGPAVTSTPRPTPSLTPSAVPIKCDGGELPHYPGTSFPHWFGYPRTRIFDGDTRTFCYTVMDSPWRVSLDVGDETDAAQCLWTETDFIPPAASGYPVEHQVGRDTSYVFFGAGSNLNGTWRIRVKVVSENCLNVFHIVARP